MSILSGMTSGDLEAVNLCAASLSKEKLERTPKLLKLAAVFRASPSPVFLLSLRTRDEKLPYTHICEPLMMGTKRAEGKEEAETDGSQRRGKGAGASGRWGQWQEE